MDFFFFFFTLTACIFTFKPLVKFFVPTLKTRLDGPADHNFHFRTGHLLLGLQKVCQSIPLPIPHSIWIHIYSCSNLVRTLAHVPFVFEHNVTTTVTITFVVIPGATIPTRAWHVISSPKQTFAHQHLAIPTQHAYLPDDPESGVAVRSRILRPSLTVTLRLQLHRYWTYPTLQVHMASGLAPRNPGPMTHPSRQGLLNQLGSFGAQLRGSGSLYLTSATLHPHLSFVHPPHFFLRQDEKEPKKVRLKVIFFFFFFFF